VLDGPATFNFIVCCFKGSTNWRRWVKHPIIQKSISIYGLMKRRPNTEMRSNGTEIIKLTDLMKVDAILKIIEELHEKNTL
jgi:hypothetical protein